MPVNLIGVAISTAFFPKLTEELGQGDKQSYYDTFRKALRTILWISLPVAIIAFFARGYVVSFISNIGSNGNNSIIVSILATLVVAIFARSVFHIASRGFYANQDTKTPFVVSIFAIGLTMILSAVFFFAGFGVEGLGWAQSIGAIVEIIILLSLLHKRSGYQLLNKTFWKAFSRMLLATLICGCVSYAMVKFVPLMSSDNSLVNTAPKFLLIVTTSAVAYVLASYFLNIKEVNPIVAKVKKTLFKNLK